MPWASYDAAFRRQAAVHHSYDWGTIDSVLYNEAFTGRALVKARCRHCLSDIHLSEQCPTVPPQLPWQPRGEPRTQDARQSQLVEVCGLFNRPRGNECRYSKCKFAHICSKCFQGPHPASRCDRMQQQRNQAQGPPQN